MNLDYKFTEITEEIQPNDFVINNLIKLSANQDSYELFSHLDKCYGSFKTMNETIECLINTIKKEGYYPNIFIQGERGHITQIELLEPIEI